MEAMPARMSNLVLQNMVFSDCDTKLATQRANSRSTKLAAGTVHVVVFLGVFAACSATFKRVAVRPAVVRLFRFPRLGIFAHWVVNTGFGH